MNRTNKTLINRIFLCIMSLSLITTATGQSKTMSKFYLQGGVGGATHQGSSYDLSMQAIIKNKWSATLSYQELTMTPKNLPADYQAETGYVFFIPYSYTTDTKMSLLSLTAGRYFKLGRNTWATTEAGLSYVSGEKVSFQHSQVTSSNLIIAASTSSNYTSTKETKIWYWFYDANRCQLGFFFIYGIRCRILCQYQFNPITGWFSCKIISGWYGKREKK
ncbi:MAG: hypothetical protein E6H08_11975 [Bacteroidetes bacterium]|nr:MAG: hypothetical protein E6H08_11975 [Bacteroidota bacterium]